MSALDGDIAILEDALPEAEKQEQAERKLERERVILELSERRDACGRARDVAFAKLKQATTATDDELKSLFLLGHEHNALEAGLAAIEGRPIRSSFVLNDLTDAWEDQHTERKRQVDLVKHPSNRPKPAPYPWQEQMDRLRTLSMSDDRGAA